MDNNLLLAGIKNHVEGLFHSLVSPNLLYHNLAHTCAVVDHGREIAKHSFLDEDSTFILLAAAWFHDTGHLLGGPKNHEELSVWLMRGYFMDQLVSDKMKAAIAETIMATKLPASPSNMIEKVICDADTYHLGTAAFLVLDPLVWKEAELRLGHTITDQRARSLAFLKAHSFYTDYCHQLLDEGKKHNIELLEQMV